MMERSFTLAQLRRDAEGWPAGLIMCDRDTFIGLCDVAEAAQRLDGRRSYNRNLNSAGIADGLWDALDRLNGVIGSANPQEHSE